MTECEFAQFISACADGQLAERELTRFEEHFPECRRCREELAQTRKLAETLTESLRDDSPIDVADRVEHALMTRRLRRTGLHATAALLAAACVLIAFWIVGLSGRGPDERSGLSAEAIIDGADWLIRAQEPDGRWKSRKHGSAFDFDIGVTALSVLALSEAHERVGDKRLIEAAEAGGSWLTGQQDRFGRFLRVHDQSRMYGQAAATLALLRLNEQRPTEQLRGSIERALAFGVRAQNARGGWSYVPGITADTSHTGWFVLALARARSAGFKVPEATLTGALHYVEQMTDAQGRVSYNLAGGRFHPGLTGTVVAVNASIRGDVTPETPASRSVRTLLSSTPSWDDRRQNLYLWFFASRGLSRSEPTETVRTWRRRLSETLLAGQERSTGKDFGSWSNNDTVHGDAGRVYSTSLAVICLTRTDDS